MGVHLGLPRPSRVTAGLMIACAVLFLMGLSRETRLSLIDLFCLSQAKVWQVWRFVTFQFLHASVRHFMFNMVGLYFFGVPLERAWGGRKFLVFYLVTGIFGGLCFILITLLVPMGPAMFLVGASGGILACLAACAILYPQMVFIIFPIRWVAAFLTVLYALSVLFREKYGDAAHLGGMAAAAAYLLLWPRVRRKAGVARAEAGRGRWENKRRAQRARQEEIDEILDKIRRRGIGALSRSEKRKLQEETHRQQRDGE